MPGLIRFVLISLWYGLLSAVALLVAALVAKVGGAPTAELLQIHESIPTAAIFFAVLGLGGWLYDRFRPRNIQIVNPDIWP
jgi:hypothetical protein